MSVTGLCQLCEAETAAHQCSRCGRVVCDDHYDEDRSVCTDCLAEMGGGAPDRTEPDPDSEPYDPTGDSYVQ